MADPMTVDLAGLDVPQLLDVQHALGDLRGLVLTRQRQVTAELDARAAAMEERRREEAALLGQVSKPPTQYVLGDGPDEGASEESETVG